MGYEIWDRNTGNLICDFDDLASALEFVREEVEAGGADAAEPMSLLKITDDGEDAEIVAQGEGLVELVRARTAAS